MEEVKLIKRNCNQLCASEFYYTCTTYEVEGDVLKDNIKKPSKTSSKKKGRNFSVITQD